MVGFVINKFMSLTPLSSPFEKGGKERGSVNLKFTHKSNATFVFCNPKLI